MAFARIQLGICAALCLLTGAARPGIQKFAVLPPVAIVSVDEVQEMIRRDSGNVVLVNVWATWCKPCLEELPSIARLNEEYATKPLRIILLSADDTDLVSTDVKNVLVTSEIKLQTYLISEGREEYFINRMSPQWSGALPTTFLYDKQGVLRQMLTGKQSYGKFVKAINSLLKK